MSVAVSLSACPINDPSTASVVAAGGAANAYARCGPKAWVMIVPVFFVLGPTHNAKFGEISPTSILEQWCNSTKCMSFSHVNVRPTRAASACR